MKNKLVLFAFLGTLLVGAFPATAHPFHHGDSECSPLLFFRTPAEVLESHRAALAAQDWQAAACNYSQNAVVISDQGITEGRDNIVAELQGIAGFFGSALPTVTEEVIVGSIARVTFSLDIGWLTIPDGIDTYVIYGGKIRQQTAHGLAVIVGPPPGPPPAP